MRGIIEKRKPDVREKEEYQLASSSTVMIEQYLIKR